MSENELNMWNTIKKYILHTSNIYSTTVLHEGKERKGNKRECGGSSAQVLCLVQFLPQDDANKENEDDDDGHSDDSLLVHSAEFKSIYT